MLCRSRRKASGCRMREDGERDLCFRYGKQWNSGPCGEVVESGHAQGRNLLRQRPGQPAVASVRSVPEEGRAGELRLWVHQLDQVLGEDHVCGNQHDCQRRGIFPDPAYWLHHPGEQRDAVQDPRVSAKHRRHGLEPAVHARRCRQEVLQVHCECGIQQSSDRYVSPRPAQPQFADTRTNRLDIPLQLHHAGVLGHHRGKKLVWSVVRPDYSAAAFLTLSPVPGSYLEWARVGTIGSVPYCYGGLQSSNGKKRGAALRGYQPGLPYSCRC